MTDFRPKYFASQPFLRFTLSFLCPPWLPDLLPDVENPASWALLRRDISFEVSPENEDGQVAYRRYCAAASPEELHHLIGGIAEGRPFKLLADGLFLRTMPCTLAAMMRHGGRPPPVPKERRKAISATQFGHEFVIDIDANDLDPGQTDPDRPQLRNCRCVGTPGICTGCWPAIAIMLFIAHHALIHRLGLEDVHTFFSGRRGGHVWCRDRNVFFLDSAQREGVLSQIDKWRGQGLTNDQMDALVRVSEMCKMPDQQRARLDGSPEAVIEVFHPRFDRSVSTATRHLTKLPYTVHPATGLVCVELPEGLEDMARFEPPRDATCTQQRVDEIAACLENNRLPTCYRGVE